MPPNTSRQDNTCSPHQEFCSISEPRAKTYRALRTAPNKPLAVYGECNEQRNSVCVKCCALRKRTGPRARSL